MPDASDQPPGFRHTRTRAVDASRSTCEDCGGVSRRGFRLSGQWYRELWCVVNTEMLGHYRLTDAFREDAAGRWHRGRDERLERDVLVLVFHAGAVTSGGGRDRVLASARALAKIEHPNVARVHAFDTVDGVDFMVSEWVAGESPRERFGGTKLRDADIVEFGAQVADALSTAHGAGVVHGRLDADHVRVTANGDVKVVGFGLPEPSAAEESCVNVTPLSLSCRSPERLRGGAATIQSDIYSLGVLLYESATGILPFGGHSVEALLTSISGDRPRGVRKLNGHISTNTERVILKCLEPEPHRRFGLANELAAALRGQVGSEAVGSGIPLPRRRTGSLVMLAIVAVVLGWGGLVWYRTGFRGPPVQPASAESAIDD